MCIVGVWWGRVWFYLRRTLSITYGVTCGCFFGGNFVATVRFLRLGGRGFGGVGSTEGYLSVTGCRVFTVGTKFYSSLIRCSKRRACVFLRS